MKPTSLCTFIAISLFLTPASAKVTFDWATIGNPGNAPDPETGHGQVDYVYRISKYEVTNDQYAEFLNAVASSSDPNQLYDGKMDFEAPGGITAIETSGNWTYEVKPGRGSNPVVHVSFFDAMRFVNWLHNGQPIGLQGPGTTEDGAYSIADGLSEVRSSSARFFVPTRDEWYKAAYHDSATGTAGEYFDFATGTDMPPYSDNPMSLNTPDDTNVANFVLDDGIANGYNDGYALWGTPYYMDANGLTDVGAYGRAASPYGTYDQSGNAYEWTEGLNDDYGRLSRSYRGGAWDGSDRAYGLHASVEWPGEPDESYAVIGFRVASIVPEPGAHVLLLSASVAALGLRRCRQKLRRLDQISGRRGPV